MEKSFRAILSEFLEENEPVKPVSPSSAPPEMSFFWQNPLPKTPNAKKSYPTSARETVLNFTKADAAPSASSAPAMASAPAKKSEIVDTLIPLNALSESDRSLIQILITLGAAELKDGVSERRLKKAHRRLAKRLHPDMQTSANVQEKARNQQLFMNLQSAYESLVESLSTYKTADSSKAA